jgi:mRNA interferase MazF
VHTRRDGLHTQADIGIEEGLKHESSIHRDELMSLPKNSLINFIGYRIILDRFRYPVPKGVG